MTVSGAASIVNVNTYTTTSTVGTVGLPVNPGATTVGQLMLVFCTIAAVPSGSTLTVLPPGGWSLVASASNTSGNTVYGVIYRKTVTSGDISASATFTAQQNSGGVVTGSLSFSVVALTATNVLTIPVSAQMSSDDTNYSTAVAIASAGGDPASGACVLSFYAAGTQATSAGTITATFDGSPAYTNGVTTFTNRAATARIALFSPGARSLTVNLPTRRVVGQVVLSGPPSASHPGKTITATAKIAARGYKSGYRHPGKTITATAKIAARGYHSGRSGKGGTLSTTAKIAARGYHSGKSGKGGTLTGQSLIFTLSTGHKTTTGIGGRITATATIAARRGVYVLTRKHYGKIVALAAITAGGIRKLPRPHLRTYPVKHTDPQTGDKYITNEPVVQNQAGGSRATRLSFPMPEQVQPTDLLVLEVGYGNPGGGVTTPTGWQLADAGPVDASTWHYTFTRIAGWSDLGTTIVVDVTGAPGQLEGVLGVYTPARITGSTVSSNTTGSTRIIVGPTTADPGGLRIAAGTGRATAADGTQVSFTTPITVVDDTQKADVRGQSESHAGTSLASFVADYDGNLAQQAQVTAVVPVIERSVVLDTDGVEFHRGTITQDVRGFGKTRGLKHANDGTNQYSRLAGYDGGSGHGSGAHSDIRAKGGPGRIKGYYLAGPSAGVSTDSYRGGEIRITAGISGARGYGTRSSPVPIRFGGAARLRALRGGERHRGTGGRLSGEFVLDVHGRRTRFRHGKPLVGKALMHALSGPTRVNTIRGWAVELGAGTGDHSDLDTTLKYHPIFGEAALHAEGINSFTILERYLQIRGYALLSSHGLNGTRPQSAGGTITGEARISAGYSLATRITEDLEVDILIGYPTVEVTLSAAVEDLEIDIGVGNVVVNRLVPYQMYTSSAFYDRASRPATAQNIVVRSEPGYPFTTGGRST